MKNGNSQEVNQVKQLINAMGCDIDCIDDDMISVDNGLWQIVVNNKFQNEIFLNFHVNACPIMAADISKRLSYLASLIEIDVVISEVYAFKSDDDGKITEMTFGSDAYETVGREHYFGFGH